MSFVNWKPYQKTSVSCFYWMCGGDRRGSVNTVEKFLTVRDNVPNGSSPTAQNPTADPTPSDEELHNMKGTSTRHNQQHPQLSDRLLCMSKHTAHGRIPVQLLQLYINALFCDIYIMRMNQSSTKSPVFVGTSWACPRSIWVHMRPPVVSKY